MFSFRKWEAAMLYDQPRSLRHHVLNTVGALVIGIMFAFVGLNAASGCGEAGGQCIGVKDLLTAPPAAPQLASR